MLFYLCCFVVFILTYKISEQSKRLFWVMVAALLPALLEGLRYRYLGTDMNGYGNSYFMALSDTSNFMDAMTATECQEYGFLSIIYISQVFSDSVNFYMFICAYIKIGIIYYIAFKSRKRLCSWMFLLSYFAVIYCIGFSMMRQSLALAFSLLAIYFWNNRKYASFLIAILIGYTMHNSALILLLVPIPKLTTVLKLNYKAVIGVFVLCIFFISTRISQIMESLVDTSIFRDELVERYMDSGVPSAKADIVLSLLFAVFSLLYIPRKKLLDYDSTMLAIMFSFLSLCFLFLSNYIEVAFRVAYYFELGLLVLIPIAIQNRFKAKKRKVVKRRKAITANETNDEKKKLTLRVKKVQIAQLLYAVLFVAYFIINARHGLSETIPYESEILPF